MKRRRVGKILLAVGVVNFVSFVAVASVIGGDAINGSHRGDRYFVAEHGSETEVSKELWLYSYTHAVSVFFSHAGFFVAAFLLKSKPSANAKP